MVFTRARDRIGRAQNIDFTTGSGINMPSGLVTSAGAGVIAATGYATTIAYDHFVDLVDVIDIGYLNRFDAKLQKGKFGPGFMFSQQMRRYVRKIKDTTGRPIWTPSYELGASAATPDHLLGYPVYINNDMPAPAANAKSVAFGDFSQYMVRDVLDMVLYRFDDSAYMTKGQVGFLAWARAGGNLLDTTAVKTFQHSAS